MVFQLKLLSFRKLTKQIKAKEDDMNNKSLFSIITILFLVLTIFSFTACEVGFGSSGDTPDELNPDPKNYMPNHSFMIKTSGNERKVAFMGTLSGDTLIGISPANTLAHGFSKDLFTETGAHRILFLDESVFNQNKENLSAPFLQDKAQTIFAFFNKFGENSVVYELSPEVGGENILRTINPSTSLNVQWHLGGIAGRIIGTAPAKMLETSISLVDGNYNLFPDISYHDKYRDVLKVVYPTNTDGSPWYITVSLGDFGNGMVLRDYTIFMNTVLKGLTIVPGMSIIVVSNQTTNGSGVRFLQGGTVMRTLSGLENSMPTVALQHGINMPTINNGNTSSYAESVIVHNLLFGPAGSEVKLQKGRYDPTPIDSLEILSGKIYTVTVTGDHNLGTLIAYISSVEEMDVSEFSFD